MIDIALNKYFNYKYGENKNIYTAESHNLDLKDTDSLEIKSSEEVNKIDLSDVYVPKKINLTIPKRKIVKTKYLVNAKKTNKKYSCDGRTWCSQMHSCEEATYFSHHCSSTMDGNGDGVPCEKQWCGY